ncbi:MAG: DUF2336 domain-containing protein [Parvibaculum sp.]|uniref:DUF2336 domain-containing protein n=1 Tax=Parvibaculum sp. TaxID=2024848 RepID=UPI0025FCB7C7|nr:DUF2336 domain-containing protein [Parvibaculum sp.]MCE9649533.1 DUF2336 domain-containing protein [Parvibaculum sp.]
MQDRPAHERLSIADVKRLLSEPTEEVRSEIAVKVASQFRNVVLTPRERDLAQEILGYLVHDVAAHVRQALSIALSELPGAPRNIVLELAHDIDEVAQPVLESSNVLTDEDLVELVLSGDPKRQCVIAARPNLGGGASDAIAWAGDRSAVIVLVANEGTIIRPDILERIVERFPSDEGVLDPMASRADLPGPLVERIITLVSKRLRDYLIERHNIDFATASLLEDQSRERALVDMIGKANPDDMGRLIAQLSEKAGLTPSLLLRATCAGEVNFIETAFAFLASVPHERVVRLIHDVGALGFRAVYARAGMPELFYPAFRAALDVLRDLERDGYLSDKPFMRHQMLGRIAPHYRDIEAADIDLLLDRLTRSARALPWGTRAA